MEGYQFARYETYARVHKKPSTDAKGQVKKEGRRAAKGVAEEHDRERGAHPHVLNALPVEYIKGLPFSHFGTAVKAIADATDQSTVKHGGGYRKVRSDAQFVVNPIFSTPLKTEHILALAPEEREIVMKEVYAWMDRNIAFCRSEWGEEAVQCAALHWDETFLHAHVTCGSTSPTTEFQTLNLMDRARTRAQGNDRSSSGRKIGNDAYNADGVRWQDAYQQQVAKYFGLTRLGPSRRRLTGSAWAAEKKQSGALAQVLEEERKSRVSIAQMLADAEYEKAVMVAKAEEVADEITKAALNTKKEAEALLKEANRRRDIIIKKQIELNKDAKKIEADIKQIEIEKAKIAPYKRFWGKVIGWLGIKKEIRAEERLKAKAAMNDALAAVTKKNAALVSKLKAAEKAGMGSEAEAVELKRQLSNLNCSVALLVLAIDALRDLRFIDKNGAEHGKLERQLTEMITRDINGNADSDGVNSTIETYVESVKTKTEELKKRASLLIRQQDLPATIIRAEN